MSEDEKERKTKTGRELGESFFFFGPRGDGFVLLCSQGWHPIQSNATFFHTNCVHLFSFIWPMICLLSQSHSIPRHHSLARHSSLTSAYQFYYSYKTINTLFFFLFIFTFNSNQSCLYLSTNILLSLCFFYKKKTCQYLIYTLIQLINSFLGNLTLNQNIIF